MKTYADLCEKYGTPRCMGGIGDGWVPIVDRLLTRLKALGWDGHIGQIKEKFGGLRVYLGAEPPGGDDLIAAAEEEAWKTCEDCGATGGVTTSGGWLRTLCAECRGAR